MRCDERGCGRNVTEANGVIRAEDRPLNLESRPNDIEEEMGRQG